MKKPPVNEEQMMSELSGSAFFRNARKDAQEAKSEPGKVDQFARVPPAQEVSTGRTPRTHRRRVRTPFDIYEDQVDSLHQFSLQERQMGELGSMSAMVREALASYIARRTKGSKP